MHSLFLVIILMLLSYIVYLTFRVEKLEKITLGKQIIEGMANPDSSDIPNIDREALENIASLYNSGNFIVTNLTVTGKANFQDVANFSKPVTIDLSEQDSGTSLTLKNAKTYPASIDFKDSNNVSYLTYKGDNIQLKNNLDNSFNASSQDVPVLKIPSKLSLVNNFEIEPGVNNTSFKSNGVDILSLPNTEEGTPVFRASGLAYTDKNADQTKYYTNADTTKLHQFFQTDKDRKNNLIFLGGTYLNDDSMKRYIVAGRKHRNGYWFAQSIGQIDTTHPVCPNKFDGCKLDQYQIN